MPSPRVIHVVFIAWAIMWAMPLAAMEDPGPGRHWRLVGDTTWHADDPHLAADQAVEFVIGFDQGRYRAPALHLPPLRPQGQVYADGRLVHQWGGPSDPGGIWRYQIIDLPSTVAQVRVVLPAGHGVAHLHLTDFQVGERADLLYDLLGDGLAPLVLAAVMLVMAAAMLILALAAPDPVPYRWFCGVASGYGLWFACSTGILVHLVEAPMTTGLLALAGTGMFGVSVAGLALQNLLGSRRSWRVSRWLGMVVAVAMMTVLVSAMCSDALRPSTHLAMSYLVAAALVVAAVVSMFTTNRRFRWLVAGVLVVMASALVLDHLAPHWQSMHLLGVDGFAATLVVVVAVVQSGFRLSADMRVLRDANRGLEALVEERTAVLDAEKTRYKLLTEQSLQGLVVHATGVVRFANRAFAEMVGHHNPEALVGRSLESLMGPDGVQALGNEEELRRRTDGGSLLRELAVATAGGRRLVALAASRAISWEQESAVQSALLDITESRSMAESLERTEAENRVLLQTVPGVIVRWRPDGVVTFINDYGCRFFGFKESEVVGRHLVESIVPPRDLDGNDMRKLIHGMATDIGDYTAHVNENRTKDGREVWCSWSNRGLYDDHGALQEVISVGLDITQRLRSEEALAKARDLAQAADQAKSDFLANMSHEIRTPMNGVIGMADLLAKTPLSDRQRDYLTTIQESGRALLGLIDDILDFSKIEAGRLELESVPFDLEALADEVVRLAGPQAYGKGIALATVVEAGFPAMVRGDPSRVRQILTNLVGNAVKFTAEGHVLLMLASGGDHDLVITVEDTGIGIDPSQREHLFEAFSQADSSTTRRFGGTGLGLAICNRLARTMGGWIDVDGAPGGGSRFRVHLALSTVEAGGMVASQALAGKRLLLVAGASLSAHVVSVYACRWGMTVEQVSSLRQAQSRLANPRSRFDGVIINVDLDRDELEGMARSWSVARMQFFGEEIERTAHTVVPILKPIRRHSLARSLAHLMGIADFSEGSLSGHHQAFDPQALASERFTVLLVEDNPINRRVAEEQLRAFTDQVLTAENGQEALDILGHQPVDLVFMDCQMPVLDGFAATRALRQRETDEQRERTTVVAMTANVLQGDRERCLAAGMDDYLSKPVQERELAAIMRRYLGIDASTVGSDEQEVREDVAALLANWRERFSAQRFEALTAVMREELPRQRAAILAARHDRDSQALGAAAHALKGSAGSLGFKGLADDCLEVETQCRAGLMPDADALRGLDDRLGQILAALDGLVQGDGAGAGALPVD